MSPVEYQYYANNHFPPGHIARAEAKVRVEQEYSKCLEIEQAFKKAWKGIWFLQNFQESANFSALLCRAVGTQSIKRVRPTDEYWCYYHNGEIFCNAKEDIVTIVHETAHHICRKEHLYKGGHHGEDFCMVEQMLFDWLQQHFPKKTT
jgi:hypothetical protein